ncbi:MAG TPA: glycosyltransferase family 1 protein, partial [Bacteroidota bacterium]
EPMARTSLRVAYFAGSMKPGHDGVTRVLYRMISSLARHGIRSVFYSAIVPPPDDRPADMVQVPSIAFPAYPEYRVPLPGQRHFDRQLTTFRPDLIHINSPCPLGYAAVQYGREHGVPVVATYHTHFPSYARYYKMRPLELLSWNYLRRLYGGCSRIYVPSMPILRELASRRIKNLKHLPHGVDTGVFNPGYRSNEWKKRLRIEGKSALLFAGRLVWEKDLETLIGTYQLLTKRRSDLVFVLAGDGPIRGELQDRMPRAVFLGQIGGADLSTAYASSDLLVFPSTTETFGNVVLEAMASGIVPVCANQGGPAGIIQQGVTGLLARPRDAASLAEFAEYLVDHPGKRAEIADQALASARRQGWDRIFDELFTDYRAVVEEYGRRLNRKRAA